MPSKFKAILVLVPIFLVRSEPVPEALPEAQAEAEPQAEPQSFGYPSYNGGGGMYNMGDVGMTRPEVLPAPVPGGDNGWSSGGSGGGSSGWYPGQTGDQCGMVDQCCEMHNQGCCVNQGQKCYKVWETKCKYANKPRCINSFQTKCQKVEIKKCRMVEEIRDITVPFENCKVEKERKCWNYTEHSCKYQDKKHEELIRWTHESLKKSNEPKEICTDVKTCKIVDAEEIQITKVPERICDKVPQPRKKCTTVYVPQPPIEQPWTDYVIEYKQQCYDIPKPVCVSKPCTYAVQTANICPTCLSPGQPGPQCTPSDPCGGGSAPAPRPAPGPAPDMCGSCRRQNVQMCTKMTQECQMKTERVCQSVPYRKAVQRTKTIQRPPIPKLECNEVTEYIESCRVEYREKENTIKVQKCEENVVNKCLPYNAPNYEVESENKEEIAEFKVKVCEIEEKDQEHCVDLPTKSTCTGNRITRQVRVKFQKCDRSDHQTVCKKFPEQNCHNSPGQVCWKEPREVCQPTCQQTNFCNTCEQFASTGGFEQCGTPSCPNFIARR